MKDFLVDILHAKENSRARSNQKEIGPSELGSCRRKVWYKLNEQPETNDNELKLAAIMGTAIHGAIESALATADMDGGSPTGRVLLSRGTTYGIRADREPLSTRDSSAGSLSQMGYPRYGFAS